MSDDEIRRRKARKDIGEYIEKKPESELIIELACDNNKFFKDQFGKGYALIKVKDHYETIALDSNRFKLYLSKLYYDFNFHRPAHKESINSAIQVLESKAEFDSPTISLDIRVAWSKDKKSIYYDLTDENWYFIRIDRSGVNLEMDLNFPLFKRYSQTPQPIPDKDFDPNVLDRFMSLTNVKCKDEILLTKVWIISTIIPEIDCTILNVHGGTGAAKTTTQKLIKIAVDPDRPENLLSVSHDKMEFIQQLSHRRIAFYDNLKYKIPWLAEEVCKAVTGGGTTKRELYSNEGDVIFDFKNCIGFNGINMIMNEPDVLRRSIIIELKSIEECNQIDKSKIFSAFEELKPQLLGYIFDTVSKAMSIKDTLVLDKLPSMADWTEWGEAISRAMGYSEMEFIEAYRRNIGIQNEHVIDTNPFAKSISLLYGDIRQNSSIRRKFVWDEELETWSISANGFIEELIGVAVREGIDTSDRRFPHSANKISNQLNIIRTNLQRFGVDVVIRQSRSKEDIDKGFNRNTMIVDIRTIRPSTLPPYYSKGAYPVGDLVRIGNDAGIVTILSTTSDQNQKNREKVTETIVTIPTALHSTTKHSLKLMLVYKDSTFLNHLQHGLRTCPKCGETGQGFYMKNHYCL